jgi:hypothetical protein
MFFVFSSVVSTYLPPATKVLCYPHMYLLPMCLKLFLAISNPIYLTKLTAGKLLNLWHIPWTDSVCMNRAYRTYRDYQKYMEIKPFRVITPDHFPDINYWYRRHFHKRESTKKNAYSYVLTCVLYILYNMFCE